MKLSSSLSAFAIVSALTGVPALALSVADLSLKPARACQTPPKSPGKLLNQGYPLDFSTGGNAPFNRDVDINGDGWCDWVSTAAQPPQRDGVTWAQPLMKDFIFLGTRSGWRRFGNHKAIRAFIDQHTDDPDPYEGDDEVTAFVSPLFIYTEQETKPYVATISILQDVIEAKPQDVVVYRWHDGFDALRQLGEQERSVVIQFLQAQYCGKKDSLPLQSVPEAVCAK